MKRVAVVLLTSAILLGACSATGDQDTAAKTTTTANRTANGSTTTAVPLPGAPTIAWHDCGGGFQCGDMEVPLDYRKPDGKKIQIAVTRHPADKPDERIGALFMNPGGPGGSAIELARDFPRAGEIGDKFDIVGFDPRGVGKSSPLNCHSHLLDIYDADPTIDSAADRKATLDASKAFVAECKEKYGDILPFLGTTDVARDMDQVRQALGDDQLSYLGYSYGTSLGQEYARLFPTHVRAMVLDGVVDHAPDGLTTAEQQAGGFRTALDSYVAHCKSDGCGFDKPADQVINEVVAKAEKEPIPSATASRPAGPGVVSLALAQALYSETLWGTLSSALRDAQDGDGSGFVDLADQYLGVDGGATSFEVYFAVSCLDDTWPTDPNKVFAAAAAAGKKDPLFGSPIVLDYIRCALWPTRSKPLKPVPADTKGLPPIIVISTTKDPATPYENGVAVAHQIPTGVLVTNEGEGHTVVGQGKPCIDNMVSDYFIDLTVPDDGLVCK